MLTALVLRQVFQRNLFVESVLNVKNLQVLVKMVGTTAQYETKFPIGTMEKIRKDPVIKKIESPEFSGIFTSELRDLIKLFARYNYEIRIAGGAVRDILMNIAPKDIDLATTATPEQMKAMFTKEDVRMINTKGEKHGTITPRINNKENFEVTTLRIDIRTDGRHAEVQFTKDWQLDANRRDLTINSMFLGFDGTLYDYFYGFEDLQHRRIVFVGNADIRIKEDFLRILRYFRFYGRISQESNNHDVTTLNAIRENVGGLSQISGERIWSELQKIVVGNFAKELVLKMINCGLSLHCGLPETPNIAEFERFCDVVESFPKSHYPILFAISLLHTYEDAIKLHERLKLSAFERDMALFITQQRDRVDKEYVGLRDYQRLCLQPFAKRDYVEELLKYCGKKELYEELKKWKTPVYPVNGNLLKEHGCPLGKQMGFVMNELKLVWIESDFTLTSKELLETHLPIILQNLPSNSPSTPRKKIRKSQ